MEQRFRVFLRVFAASTLAALAVVCLLNLLVDPLGAYPSFSLGAFEPYRGQLTSRSAKAELIARGGCDILLLGSSRVVNGIPVQHPAYGAARAVNLALDGTNLSETWSVLDLALRHNQLQHVLLGIDLHMFSDKGTRSGFESSRFNPDLALFDYHAGNLLGAQAANTAWELLWQRLTGAPPLGERGFVSKVLPRTTCQRELFARRIRTSITNPGADPSYRPSPVRRELFRRMVRRCRDESVPLTVFIPPVHALQLETLHEVGLWPEFELWKRDLTRILSEEGATASVPLWDFTGYSGAVAEPLPPEGDSTTRMKWHLETSHFMPALGERVLARVLGGSLTGPEDADFGVKLTPQNLESHLAGLRADRETYATTHPGEIELVRRMVAAGRGKNAGADGS